MYTKMNNAYVSINFERSTSIEPLERIMKRHLPISPSKAVETKNSPYA